MPKRYENVRIVVHIWLECNPNLKTVLRETSNQIKSELRTHKARRTVSFNYPRFMLRTRPVINLVLSTVRAAERKEKVTAQMSRRGNPYDDALAENFFSIVFTEPSFKPMRRRAIHPFLQ